MTSTGPNATFTPTAKDMEAVYNGIPVSTYGEDGNMLALGHIDQRAALDVFNQHAREHLGLANVLDAQDMDDDEVKDDVRHTWQVFHRGAPNGDWLWEAKTATQSTPNAVAVTLLNVE